MLDTGKESEGPRYIVRDKILKLISSNPTYTIVDIKRIVGEVFDVGRGSSKLKGTAATFEYIYKRILQDYVYPQLEKAQRTQLRQKEVQYEYEMQKKARIDDLTGLYRRDYFKERLSEEIVKNKTYWFAMIDLDHFKACNDDYGRHEAGDVVLKKVSEILRENFEKDGLLGRWGGEEFLLAVPQNKIDDAAFNDKIEKLRREYTQFVSDNYTKPDSAFKGTMSLGLYKTDFNDSRESIDRSISRADIALYEAKKTRNTIVSLTSQISAPKN